MVTLNKQPIIWNILLDVLKEWSKNINFKTHWLVSSGSENFIFEIDSQMLIMSIIYRNQKVHATFFKAKCTLYLLYKVLITCTVY